MSKHEYDCVTCADWKSETCIVGGTPCTNWRPAENKRICANCACFDAVNMLCNRNGLPTVEYEDACYNWRDCWEEDE